NRDWGYRRILAAISNLGHNLARGTIANILKRHGIEPAPEGLRKTTWKEFLTRHWELIVAADFFTVEVWTRRGLQRYIVLFFIELSTRRVEVAGIPSVANGLWMTQIARNISDTVDGLVSRKRYLIHDRDPLFTAEFLNILADSGVKSVKLPPRSPNLNAYAERFVRTIKESCLDRLILFGEDSLRKSVQELPRIIILNAITKDSVTGSSCPIRLTGGTLARSDDGSGSAECSINIIVTPRKV